MKVVIAGSRGLNPSGADISAALNDAGWIDQITEVVSGTAPGVDRAGERWAAANGVKVARMPADWHQYGKRAGYLRNRTMGEYGDVLLLFWDGVSSGSKMMLEIMQSLGKPYVVVRP